MHEAVDPRFDLDEDTEIGDVTHLPAEDGARRIALRDARPRIGLELLHSEGNLLPLLVDVQDLDLDELPERHHLTRMTNMLSPTHFGNVDEAFDALLELDERSVIRDRDDLALDRLVFRVLLFDVLPRMRLKLFQAERDTLALLVIVENHDVELLIEVDELGGMRDAAPREIRNVKKAVDAAQIDEDAEVRYVLDDAFENLSAFHRRKDARALRFEFLLDERLVRDDDVLVCRIELDDLELHLGAQIGVEVSHWSHVDLRSREKGLHGVEQLDDHTALDSAHDRTVEHLFVFVRFLNSLPATDLIGSRLRQHELSVVVFEPIDKYFDFVAGLELTPEFIQ